MCGINGILDWRHPVDSKMLIGMRETLLHRGPDDAGLWIRHTGPPFVGFGHCRLSIIDLSEAGHQPMHYNSGDLTVVFNGEIYNYIELRKELEKVGCIFRSDSDTEVLLAAYSVWGTNCLERFNGMFAFALWDERNQVLFAARDRFGKKPFFFRYKNKSFQFASEMKGIFCLPEVDCRPDVESLNAYISSFTIECGDRTMFEGITRLRPSEALLLSSEGNLKRWYYWQLQPKESIKTEHLDDIAEEFLELFRDSVNIRLRADVPVGSSLSGGLDSTAIVCTMAQQLKGSGNNSQKTFSACFPDCMTVDEGNYIDSVVNKTGVQAYRTSPTPFNLIQMIYKVHYYQEEPFLSSSIFAQWEVMRLANRENVTILLDGQGGDEILAGYVPYFLHYWLDLALSVRWFTLLSEVLPFFMNQFRAMMRFKNYSERFIVLSPFFIANAWIAHKRHKHAKNTSGSIIENPNTEENPFKDRLTATLYRDLTQTHIPQLLRYADRNSMAFSREIRNPFLDYRLVEYLFSLPPNLKIRRGWNKFILRKAFQGIIPDKVRTRFDKVGYITPEAQWLRGPLKDWAQNILFGKILNGLKGYRSSEIQYYWKKHQSGKHGYCLKLWPWISLAIWLEMIEKGYFKPREDL